MAETHKTASKECIGSRDNRNTNPKIVEGVTRPWWWGTDSSPIPIPNEAQKISWCVAAGVDYHDYENLKEMADRINQAVKLRRQAAYPAPKKYIPLWMQALLKRFHL